LCDKGTRQSPGRGYLVLRECQVPCILLETAFLSNPADEAHLKSDSFRQRTAEAIAAGLADYFNNIKSTAYDNNN
jgi:N-acetylmuramoyl-L-alanine amidase